MTVFENVVANEADLRELYQTPSGRAIAKEIDHLDDHCRALIARAPFVLLATAGSDGRCDASPKGGPPGFVQVLDDHRLAFGDLPGNNRVDSMRNLFDNGRVGLLFLVPGLEETLRVNGRAWVVRDDDVLDVCTVEGRRPKTAIGVEVDEVYIHCAKAFKRAELWNPTSWPDRATLPSIACALRDHAKIDATPEQVDAALQDAYTTTLWRD